MKQTATSLFVLICLFTATSLSAQTATKKPLLFKQYPAVIHCSGSQLNALFIQKKGEQAALNFDGSLQLKGTITSSVSKFNNDLQTVVIALPDFSNSIFSLSKRKEKGKADVFIGHLYNNSFADGYQLKQLKNDDYQLVKISSEQVLQPCTF